MSERDLDPFLDAARALLDARLDEHGAMLDLEDVVQQAHALAPDHVSRSMVERAGRHPASPPGASSPVSAAHSTALEAFEADTRALLDAELAPRDLAAVVPPRARRPSRRPRWTWAAAAIVLLVAGGAIAGIGQLRGTAAPPAMQAEHVRADPPTREASHETASGTVQPRDAEPMPEPVEPTPAPAPDGTGAQAPSPAPSHRAPDGESASEHLAELDALAQAQWKAGNLRAAEKTFRKIVKLGGRTPYAEQAYGELFALAHQLHDDEPQAKLWRAYLRRFPHGRYADTARADLCRESEGKAKRQCWTRYLQKHPSGAARAEALRETAE